MPRVRAISTSRSCMRPSRSWAFFNVRILADGRDAAGRWISSSVYRNFFTAMRT